ncbi:MAG: M13 family peptidase, partial [Dokdonella sp.]
MNAIFRTVLAVSLLAALAACDRAPSAPAAPAPVTETAPAAIPTPPPPKPAFGTFGFDATGMNADIAAGDDFFSHVNGHWVDNTEIPADRSRMSNFSLIDQAVQKDLKVMLEGAAADRAADGERRQMGDYYAAFMDEESIAAKGVAPIKTELASIESISDKKSLATALGESLRADVDLLNATNYHTDRLLGLWVSQDLNKPGDYAAYLVQGGLGMPDRDFYLEDGRMAELRTQYQAHIAKMLALAGVDDVDAKAVRVVALETAMARVHASQLETNDVAKGNNVWTSGQFAKKAPGLDWSKFMAAAGLDKQASFIVCQPAAITGLSKLVKSESLDAWKDWMSFHAIDRAAAYLPKAFDDQHFAFHDQALSGTPEQSERWKLGIDETNTALGESVGKVYVERHFTPETKARADAMVANILTAFGKRIQAVEWMTAPTKARAEAKLATLTVSMGYPVKWRDYSTLEVRRDDALGNAERASLFEYQRNLAKL